MERVDLHAVRALRSELPLSGPHCRRTGDAGRQRFQLSTFRRRHCKWTDQRNGQQRRPERDRLWPADTIAGWRPVERGGRPMFRKLERHAARVADTIAWRCGPLACRSGRDDAMTWTNAISATARAATASWAI